MVQYSKATKKIIHCCFYHQLQGESNMTKPVTIKATVYWAELNKRNQFSDKYQVTLGDLSDNAVAALEEMGVEVKDKGDEKGLHIVTKSNYPIPAYKEDNSVINENTLIANGSKALASIGFYDWSFRGNKGRSPTLNRLVVTDLVEYNDAGPIEMDEAL